MASLSLTLIIKGWCCAKKIHGTCSHSLKGCGSKCRLLSPLIGIAVAEHVATRLKAFDPFPLLGARGRKPESVHTAHLSAAMSGCQDPHKLLMLILVRHYPNLLTFSLSVCQDWNNATKSTQASPVPQDWVTDGLPDRCRAAF